MLRYFLFVNTAITFVAFKNLQAAPIIDSPRLTAPASAVESVPLHSEENPYDPFLAIDLNSTLSRIVEFLQDEGTPENADPSAFVNASLAFCAQSGAETFENFRGGAGRIQKVEVYSFAAPGTVENPYRFSSLPYQILDPQIQSFRFSTTALDRMNQSNAEDGYFHPLLVITTDRMVLATWPRNICGVSVGNSGSGDNPPETLQPREAGESAPLTQFENHSEANPANPSTTSTLG